MENGSDAIIVTGKWTGQSPDINELKEIRSAVGSFPILVGSGTDKNNVSELFKYANGAIVSASLKEGNITEDVNVKSYAQRIDEEKVKILVGLIKI